MNQHDDYLDWKFDREQHAKEINAELDFKELQRIEDTKMSNYSNAVAREREQDIQSWIATGLTREQAEFNSIMWS